MLGDVEKAVSLMREAKRISAFTGAGISVESGIPPFRGKGGLWEKYDARIFDISYFRSNTQEAWKIIRDVFFSDYIKAEPNSSHILLAKMEEEGMLYSTATQNIDGLHLRAGSKRLYELHGNGRMLSCLKCDYTCEMTDEVLKDFPPCCPKCEAYLKPSFVFFGESLPEYEIKNAFLDASESDLYIILGTSGVVMPAGELPFTAKRNGAKIIEINMEESAYSNVISDIFIKGKSAEISKLLSEQLFS